MLISLTSLTLPLPLLDLSVIFIHCELFEFDRNFLKTDTNFCYGSHQILLYTSAHDVTCDYMSMRNNWDAANSTVRASPNGAIVAADLDKNYSSNVNR